ncbi:asparagine synthetase B family protein [Litchfieldella rifensis]|uniref:asparagine synthase (glutamine-hydrolyzing) n=1 Tax=Litchfieldella rifensis TaxID=762643 RepID=A0ABV7LSP4_9GAMM
MSAIAGIIRSDGRPVDRTTLERMQTLLTPYGQDAQNHWYQGSATLLRTLLRTTPEDRLDHQPLVDAASGITLVFDGRLDNRDEIARALDLPAAETALMADSDLVLRACLRWDTQAAEHLLGDFALACWQASRRRLWLARDPLGTRPLFWHQQPGSFAFATMPKALFAIPGITKALCEERLHDYLCLLPMTGPESFFKDIYRVEPGHTLVLEGERVTTHRYHRFDAEREILLPNDDDYLEAFREQLERAVACRLRAIGPVATHLSSGFDSSTVTAVAARQLAERNAPLLAYTAVPRKGFSGPVPRGRHADEEPGARALAARFANIEHILIRTDGTSPIDSLREDTETMDRAPFNPCNMVWVNAIRADAARRGAKVLLSATMGNMTISYDGAPYLPALLGRGEWLTWWRENRALNRRLKVRWRRLLKYSLAAYTPVALWTAFERYRGRDWDLTAHSAIHPAFMARMRTRERAKKAGWDLSYRPWADGRRMRIAGLNRFDNGDYYSAVNPWGLELRDPTADRYLIEFCLAVPDSQYLREGQSRWLLRRLMGDVLPAEILHARTRGLQAADWYEDTGQALPRLREELAQLMAHGNAGDYLDLEALGQALEEWPDSGWGSLEIEKTYRLKLLRGLSVGAFIRYADEGNE